MTTHSSGKHQYFSKANHGSSWKRKRYEIRNNGSGVLVTLGSPLRIRDGVAEFFRILDQKFPCNVSDEETAVKSTADNLTDELANELKNIKTNEPRTIPFTDISKGVCFFQFTPSMKTSANDVVYKLLTDFMSQDSLGNDFNALNNGTESCTKTLRRRQMSCRFIQRLIPIDITCAPHPVNVYRAAQVIVSRYFPASCVAADPSLFTADIIKNSKSLNGSNNESISTENVEPSLAPSSTATPNDVSSSAATSETSDNPSVTEQAVDAPVEFQPAFTVPSGATWSIVMERRGGMTTIDRDTLIDKLGAYVGSEYKVNLTSPDYTILIQVLPAFCGLSVVRSYSKLLHYNVHRLCHPTLYKSSKEHPSKSENTVSSPQ